MKELVTVDFSTAMEPQGSLKRELIVAKGSSEVQWPGTRTVIPDLHLGNPGFDLHYYVSDSSTQISAKAKGENRIKRGEIVVLGEGAEALGWSPDDYESSVILSSQADWDQKINTILLEGRLEARFINIIAVQDSHEQVSQYSVLSVLRSNRLARSRGSSWVITAGLKNFEF